MKRIISIIVLFIMSSHFLYADEKKLYPAILGGLFVNTVFHIIPRAFGIDFAQTDLDSIKTNLRATWVWEKYNDYIFISINVY